MLNIVVYNNSPPVFIKGLCCVAELLVSLDVLLAGRQESLPWLGKDLSCIELINTLLRACKEGCLSLLWGHFRKLLSTFKRLKSL